MKQYFGDDEKNNITSSIKVIRQASKLCDACPVFEDCLRSALENREEFGVWAGTSGRLRKRGIFPLLDNGETSVEEVVTAFMSGRGHQYRQAGGGKRERDRVNEAGSSAEASGG